MKSDLPKLLLDIKDGVIDLGWGHPSARLHPLQKIKQSTLSMLGYDHAESLQYGASQGYGPFIETLARFLSQQKGYSKNKVFSNQLFITSGASQAIDFICTLLTVAGDSVLVENPTYFVVEGMLNTHKLNVIGVNCNENGLDLDDLEHKLKSGLKPKFLYTIPTFHNPTGTTMPSQNRQRLVSLANKYNFHIVAEAIPDHHGVFVKKDNGQLYKIASIGLKVKKWVTYHGFSININPDLSHYEGIKPCGMSSKFVTSFSDLGYNIKSKEIDKTIEKTLVKYFN